MSDEVPEQPSVLVVGGMIDGHHVVLTPGLSLIVGSGRLANLRLDHPDIELAHIKIRWDELGISLVDNGSRRGTWVNGEPVESAQLLDGDVITFVAPDEEERLGEIQREIGIELPRTIVPGFECGQTGGAPGSPRRAPRSGPPRGDAPRSEDGGPPRRRRRRSGRGSKRPAAAS